MLLLKYRHILCISSNVLINHITPYTFHFFHTADPTITESQDTSERCAKHKMFHKYRDGCYRVINNSVTNWFEADTECMKYDGHLASIQDIHEQIFVNDLMKEYETPVWIGLSKAEVIYKHLYATVHIRSSHK